MSQFTTPLIVKALDGSRWQVMEPFEYHVGKEDSTEVITIPKWFITDFASIPRIFWTLVGSPTGRYSKAAVVHDWLYHRQYYERNEADKIFLEAMQVLKVPWWKRRIMWLAVRVFGFLPWNKRRREILKERSLIYGK